jgi:signal transduction histidine kinase
MYAWIRQPVPVLRVARGDLLLALALSLATLLLGRAQVGGVPDNRVSWGFQAATADDAGAAPWPRAAISVREASDEPGPPSPPARALALFVTLPLAFRRRWPFGAFAVQAGGVFAAGAGGAFTVVGLAALLVGAATLAAAARRPVLALGVLAGVAGAMAVAFSRHAANIPSGFAPFAVLLPVGLAGITQRAARLRAAAFQQWAEALAREQEQATRTAVATERARIARELHDVVSHHVSVITIQAGAAVEVLDSDPESARGAMVAVECSGREAMGELRQLLGLLTPSADEGGAPGPLAPQPGPEQIPAMVESVRAAGLPVRLRLVGGAVLPFATGLTAYRVVQEALTNALRYAPGAETTVTVEVKGDEFTIDVSNAAPGSPPHGGAGSGAGLIGLAERLRLHGGTLLARPRADGGFTVRARIPLTPHTPLTPHIPLNSRIPLTPGAAS